MGKSALSLSGHRPVATSNRKTASKGSHNSNGNSGGSLNPSTTSHLNISNQPRKFEPADEIHPLEENKQKDNSMRLEVGSFADGNPASHSRNVPSQSNFLFNPARQDSINTLLNNYSTSNASILSQSPSAIPNSTSKDTTNQQQRFSSSHQSQQQKAQSVDSNFPSYYLNNRETTMNIPSNSNNEMIRPRLDSIFLQPPINSQLRSTNNEFGNNQSIPVNTGSNSSNNSNPISSRSNSIFSSLIQMPGSNGNSVSEPSSSVGNNINNTNDNNDNNSNNNKSSSLSNNSAGGMSSNGARPRQLSVFPSFSGQDQISLEDLENLLNKESLGNLLAWQQQQDPKGTQSKSKRGSLDLSLWDNSGLPGSISGFSGSLSDIIAGISNGNIDFSNMSNEKRRDSILKIINDSQNLKQQRTQSNSSAGETKLREDIFDKAKQKSGFNKSPNRDESLPVHPNNKDHISSKSSVSSKSSAKYNEEPQSPKTSPTIYNSGLNQPQQLDPPSTTISGQQMSVQPPIPARLFQNFQPPNQYPYSNFQGQSPSNFNNPISPSTITRNNQTSYLQLQQAQKLQPAPTQPYMPPNYQLPQSSSLLQQPLGNPPISFSEENNKNLIPVQQYIKSEDGRPLLGATKIDQLMLVIQARDKGVTNPIQQAPDGSLLGPANVDSNKSGIIPQPTTLVGGVDKPHKVKSDSDDGSLSPDDKKKKKRTKNQECPYCHKYFTQSTHLEVHVRSHIGYKPFECSYCHKRFTQGGNLRTHLRLHTGEKPFSCEICKRSFSRKGNLAAHKLTHENLKPFECRLDGCDKSFTQLGNLKSHQNRFHLATLNELTHKLAELSGPAIDSLPHQEKELLNYFKELYKNSNKGIRGRGKRVAPVPDSRSQSPSSFSTSPLAMRNQFTSSQQQPNQPTQPQMDFINNNFRDPNGNVNRYETHGA